MSKKPSMVVYKNSLEHLLEELRRIDLMIRLQVLKFRTASQGGMDEFQGLCIKEKEIDAILGRKDVFTTQPEGEPSGFKPLVDHLAALEATISGKRATSLRKGIVLRLERLKELFQLSPFDVDALLICLAPELDLRYERLYAYVQDDVTKKRPSVDLVLKLLCPSFDAKMAARTHFIAEASLIKYYIVYLFDDPSYQQPPMLGKYLKVDERVVNYLLGSDEPDSRLLPYSRVVTSEAGLEELLLPADIKRSLALMVQKQEKTKQGLIFYFQGPYGVGKQSTAEALCHERGIGLLSIDLERLANAQGLSYDRAVRLAQREALLQKAALYWEGFDALLTDDKRALLEVLLGEMEERRGLIFLAGNTTWEPVDALHDTPFVRIEFPRPSFAERVQLWAMSLDGHTPHGPDVDLKELANKFRFSGGQIRDTAATARNLARWHDPENSHVTMDDLYTACRLQSNRKLAELAQKITPHYTWDDIVLPVDRIQQLREICNYVKYRSFVYDQWGFDRKLSLGKGLNVLFAGPSGTGKTMAAEIIANELELDLYKIDLSTVVSKYIGETEKNLSKIFKEAENSNAILFFDEADALFGKRSEVKDAHDRYANIEISYLLQKMEEYEGITILATNLMQNIDEAFVRRIRFIVEFPFPTETYRLLIWQSIWPNNTPLSPEIDLRFMAEQFELAGGSIRNISLNAAFYAAENGRCVTMQHLIQATKRELQKMGKLFVKADFGVFQEYV